MSTLHALTGRDYLSYSSLTSWLDCGERFRLERVLDAPQGKAWWFLAGDAIHKATEMLDLGQTTDPEETFLDLFDNAVGELVADGVDLTSIKAGGRKSEQWPDKENLDYWRAEGPGMVQGWVQWRDARFAEGWQFLDINGSPAIEVAVEVDFPDVRVKGYIDRVMVDPNGQVHVIDIKSGSRVPESSLQLGIYSLGLAHNYGVSAPLGAYYMTRKGTISQPVALSQYSYERVGSWFSMARKGIEAEVFIPKVSSFCNSCSVAPYCSAVGGSDSGLATSLSA